MSSPALQWTSLALTEVNRLNCCYDDRAHDYCRRGLENKYIRMILIIPHKFIPPHIHHRLSFYIKKNWHQQGLSNKIKLFVRLRRLLECDYLFRLSSYAFWINGWCITLVAISKSLHSMRILPLDYVNVQYIDWIKHGFSTVGQHMYSVFNC